MNREDIIHMAREAGWTQYSLLYPVEVQRLEHFAYLVAAHERESILHTVDELTDDRHPMFVEGYHLALHHIGQCIEGRGKE
jgi:hypothetical protein